jgi:ribonuclease Z
LHGVELLIHECNFADGQEEWAAKTGHSCATPVAQVAAAAGANRLVFTHFDPLADASDSINLAAVRKIFPATELGYDGMELAF